MAQFGEFIHIDKMAMKYNYTHDDAFNLTWAEFMTILVLNRKREGVESRFLDIKRKSNDRNK